MCYVDVFRNNVMCIYRVRSGYLLNLTVKRGMYSTISRRKLNYVQNLQIMEFLNIVLDWTCRNIVESIVKTKQNLNVKSECTRVRFWRPHGLWKLYFYFLALLRNEFTIDKYVQPAICKLNF